VTGRIVRKVESTEVKSEDGGASAPVAAVAPMAVVATPAPVAPPAAVAL
jgi:hypothetical protein